MELVAQIACDFWVSEPSMWSPTLQIVAVLLVWFQEENTPTMKPSWVWGNPAETTRLQLPCHGSQEQETFTVVSYWDIGVVDAAKMKLICTNIHTEWFLILGLLPRSRHRTLPVPEVSTHPYNPVLLLFPEGMCPDNTIKRFSDLVCSFIHIWSHSMCSHMSDFFCLPLWLQDSSMWLCVVVFYFFYFYCFTLEYSIVQIYHNLFSQVSPVLQILWEEDNHSYQEFCSVLFSCTVLLTLNISYFI